ncbi:MAG: hypothetical protein HQL82_02200 [Magnetococcales bacterium]|nr:hypothetical protein [Magnetococcales bacterium]
MGDSNAERQKRFADRAKASGKVRINAWIDQDAAAQLKEIARLEGVQVGEILNRMLLAPLSEPPRRVPNLALNAPPTASEPPPPKPQPVPAPRRLTAVVSLLAGFVLLLGSFLVVYQLFLAPDEAPPQPPARILATDPEHDHDADVPRLTLSRQLGQ